MSKTLDRVFRRKVVQEKSVFDELPSLEENSSSKTGSFLQRLREKRGMSQRTLAEKAGISRGRLRRLEGAGFEEATYAELKRISEVLATRVEEMLQENEGVVNQVSFSRAGETAFQMNALSSGYRMDSFFAARSDFFGGKIFVGAKKVLLPGQLPQAKIIFLQVVLGVIKVEREGEKYELHEGDRIVLSGDLPYRLENPLFRDSVAFLITVPSF